MYFNLFLNNDPDTSTLSQRTTTILWRTVRGMLQHKSPKGAAALGRLKCFDGVPLTYNGKKRMVVTGALKVNRLKVKAKHCSVGEVACECGWTRRDLITSLETRRLAKNKEWHKKRVERVQARRKLNKDPEIQKINKELEGFGY